MSKSVVLSATSAMLLVAGLGTGCAGPRVVNTDDSPTATPGAPSAPPTPPPSNAHLVDAADYVSHPEGGTRYFFTTPSGRWACAIVPRVRAGCRSANNWQSSMGITGEPETVTDAAGQAVPPNAVVVEREADPRFVALDRAEFTRDPGPANVLPFNRTLAAAGFRCNVQESGVSCLSERSGKGFTFSDDGFVPRYTDVPADAP